MTDPRDETIAKLRAALENAARAIRCASLAHNPSDRTRADYKLIFDAINEVLDETRAEQ